MNDYNALRPAVEAIAREAGALLRAPGGSLRTVEFLDQRDVKLQADRETEILIRQRLAQLNDWPVFGEEQGGDPALTRAYTPYWVVDPLDGTHNFLRNTPQCAVSIGLMRGETPILGVIYDFHLDECFSGVVADHCYLNGQALVPNWAQAIAQASLVTGFPAGMEKSPANLQQFIQTIAPYKKVRMLGTAALGLAYVAAGRYDAYFERGIRLWDVAAGLALVQAAGGTVRMAASPSGKAMAYDVWAVGRPEFIVADAR
jgi:myo-inositol-1(or 4)-monophosphatase